MAAKETNTDAAVQAVVAEMEGFFFIKRITKNSTEGFFRFTTNWLL